MSKQAVEQALKEAAKELLGAVFLHQVGERLLVTGTVPSVEAGEAIGTLVEAHAGALQVDFRLRVQHRALVVVRDAPEENPRITGKREKLHDRRKELAAAPELSEEEVAETQELLTWLQENPPLESFNLDASEAFFAAAPASDHLRVLAQLSVAPGDLLERATGKARSSSVSDRLGNAIELTGFVAPIVVDTRLRIIDGRWRLLKALAAGYSQVPIVIVECTEEQATYLRVILNKSAEFQRWKYDEVDDFLASHADEYLGVLEPLGIFGERIIPKSFLGNTVFEYRIHDAEGMATQQKFYKQERGLAKWAELARAELEQELAKKLQQKQAKEAQKAPQSHSLFG